MKKSILIFCSAFVVGLIIAFVVRTARHKPSVKSPETPVPIAAQAVHSGHSGHEHTKPAPEPAAASPIALDAPVVNTICPICGMEVDPALPAAVYEGKRVGFGCKACPPKFAADPSRYGPYALKNEVAP